MNTGFGVRNNTRRAYTLVELLVVMSVIAVLAALTFPAVRGVRISMTRARAKSELIQMETAIERYKDKFGHYPPDARIAANADPYALNQLYYELLGTTNVTIGGVAYYQTLDGSAQIPADPNTLKNVFGPSVAGFMNCARTGGEEAVNAMGFLRGLKPSQFLAVDTPAAFTALGSGLEGSLMYQANSGLKINPWRYNVSSPTNNVKSFDLWIDVMAGEKTNRICNWSDKPIVVSTPYK